MNALFQAPGEPGGHGLDARLYEIALGVTDIACSVDFYEKAFGYLFEAQGGSMLGLGPRRRLHLVEAPEGRAAISHVGYAVANKAQLAALRARLEAAGVEFQETDRIGYLSGALTFADPDGNCLVFGLAEPSAGEPTNNALPAHLQHAVFASAQIESMLNYYRDVVGFGLSDCVVNDAGELTTFFGHCSEEHHSLAVFRTSESRFDHHCFEAGDWGLIRDWADHFANLHIPIQWGPGRHGPGNNLFLFIHDPDGYWLEISAELETLVPGRKVGVWPHEERTLNSWGMALLRK